MSRLYDLKFSLTQCGVFAGTPTVTLGGIALEFGGNGSHGG